MAKQFEDVDPKVDFPKLEEKILEYWKKNNIFEKSVKKDSPKGKWTFLDGPPFVTGSPHYGSLLSSIPKDLFGRYWTMKGYRVRRVWGWDGHGLPIENKVETALGIKSKKEIEDKIGVKRFIDECKKYVSQVSAEWEWYIDKIGRWVDFKNAYKTWDKDYMESVMWVFKQMYDKGFIYKGLKNSLYCPHCATPISNFEVAMDADNYKTLQDFATTYKYQLEDEKDTYILAWSTTPWNKIVTPALAVNPTLIYVKVKQAEENYILAKSTLKMLKDTKYKILEEFKGAKLVGRKYKPHYDYYPIQPGEKAFEIIEGNFVTAEEGTGVVTIAPYGEEDLRVMQEQNIHIEIHLDEEGHVKPDVPKFGGMYYLKANKAVNDDLANRGLIYKDEQMSHSVPLCWRCHTRLYNASINAWYVNVQSLKPLLKKTNENVNWFPKHFKYGRFLKSLENAPDWNISRNRYWGSPVPVWECSPAGGCGERFVPGSIEELEKRASRKIEDLHKPLIDEVMVKCIKCGKLAKRVPEVLDSWIESGSASFAERHFPFNQNEKLEDFFPPDFIAEYTGQIRAWFYVMHVIGGALYKTEAFKNVVVEGVILGTDGRKMSKNFGNYPDPKALLQKYGGDALRLYLMGSPVMKGEDILISEDQYKTQVRGTMLILWNSYSFFVTYSNLAGWNCMLQGEKLTVLDKWILAKLTKVVIDTNKNLDEYNTADSLKSIEEFIVKDFSTWYIRRSRDRVNIDANKEDRNTAFSVMYGVLVILSKLLAPFTPFISEEMFINLVKEESVHLQNYPIGDKSLLNEKLIKEMEDVRKIVELGHSKRKELAIKVRQPLAELIVKSEVLKIDDRELLNLIKDELNVKKVSFKKEKGDLTVDLDTNITKELKDEGEARDIARKIQEERKKIGTRLDEKVNVSLEDWPVSFEEYIKNKALVNNIQKGDKFVVTRAS